MGSFGSPFFKEMEMSGNITVQALRTFDNGSGLKTAESEPFTVSRYEARELQERGLVSFVVEEATPAKPKRTSKP